ncbi:Protein CBR-SEC-24.1 [Caenorhabditis briggsae]|uniref:Protein CBR-SEC-24.1 n=1 Tax=Caenorhabditis briggsae TaxID=6238 RepID=A8X0U5_CAEBR|nr:Protein CBR-SEC-24.1 [Caenorhabditis briggsae]CAP26255.2 Protein CBR-SEC-24.1 [Caenorhabditis briggsae]
MAYQSPQYGQPPGNPQQQFNPNQQFQQNGFPQPGQQKTVQAPGGFPPQPVPQQQPNGGFYQNGAANGTQSYAQPPGPVPQLTQSVQSMSLGPRASPAPQLGQPAQQMGGYPGAPTAVPPQAQFPGQQTPQFNGPPQNASQISQAPPSNTAPQQAPIPVQNSTSSGSSVNQMPTAPSFHGGPPQTGVPGGPGGPGAPQPPHQIQQPASLRPQAPGYPPAPGVPNFQPGVAPSQPTPNNYPGMPQPTPGNYPGAPAAGLQQGPQGNYPGAQPATQQGAPRGFPPGPSPPGAFPPVPGAPSNFPPGGPAMPGAFPPAPQGPSAFPPGASGAYPQGPNVPGQYPQVPGAAGTFPQGPGVPGGFPQAPGAPGMPGMPGGYPGGPPQQRQQRLDPNMMPSAVQVIDEDSARSGIFPTGYPHAELPPLVSTFSFAQDQGNCNPKFMRSTLYTAPQTNDILKASQIPLAVVISPFAPLNEYEVKEPPVVDLGPQGPIRCQRCKAYICPFMEFQDGGRSFRCPFCHARTSVEDAYFAHLDHTGRRTDIEMRPELCLGAYDLVATKQYCKNGLAPKEPAFIFMIDVSYNALSNGMLPILCQNLEKVLRNLPRETGQLESSIRVGLATFDQAVHFFDISSASPKMLVMSDVLEPFVPMVDGLLLPYNDALPGLRAALAEIPKIFAQSKTTETILQPVVQAGLDALKCADRAGKLIVFSTVLPTFDAPGKLKSKNDRSLLGTDKEKTALVPQEESYTKLGEQCVKSGVTVDMFLFPNAFIDVATIGQLSAVTGGSVFKFQYFSADKDGVRMLNELERHVSKKIAFDCMARVRTSTGIRPITFSGSFYMENSTDLELATIDESKAFITEIKHDDTLKDQASLIQTAVLYTSMTGQRRLRILNMCLPVTADYNQVYKLADPEALTTFMLKQAVQLNRDRGSSEMKESLSSRCAQFLATYREKCSEGAPLGQLILPESLKLMPLYVNSILKNDAISGGSEMTVDDKVWQMELIRGMRTEDVMPLIYPRVMPVSDLRLNDGEEMEELPKPVRAGSDFLDNSKAYIIDNGIVLFVWVGALCPQQWIQDVFGVGAANQIDTESGTIPEKDNSHSRALRRAIQCLPRGIRQRKTFVVVEKTGLEPWMKKFLVEDKSGASNMSYVDYLVDIHRKIRDLIS